MLGPMIVVALDVVLAEVELPRLQIVRALVGNHADLGGRVRLKTGPRMFMSGLYRVDVVASPEERGAHPFAQSPPRG